MFRLRSESPHFSERVLVAGQLLDNATVLAIFQFQNDQLTPSIPGYDVANITSPLMPYCLYKPSKLIP
ncbi:MAG: hypothetical protein WCA07_14610 [Gloeobacterales cyanobacterium]